MLFDRLKYLWKQKNDVVSISHFNHAHSLNEVSSNLIRIHDTAVEVNMEFALDGSTGTIVRNVDVA